MSAGSQIWVSSRAGPALVVQHFHCQVQPAAENRDTGKEKTEERGESTLQKSTDRLWCLCRLCAKVRSCEEIGTFSQCSLPGSQGSLVLSPGRTGLCIVSNWCLGCFAYQMWKQTYEIKRAFFLASDPLQLEVFQVFHGTLLQTEILVLEKKSYALKQQRKQERYGKVTSRRLISGNYLIFWSLFLCIRCFLNIAAHG